MSLPSDIGGYAVKIVLLKQEGTALQLKAWAIFPSVRRSTPLRRAQNGHRSTPCAALDRRRPEHTGRRDFLSGNAVIVAM